jgi:CHASE3 domain sensor protein
MEEQPAMDWILEKSPWMSSVLGCVLVFAWGVMSLAHAYEQSLAKVNDSFDEGFMVVGQIGTILSSLDRLTVDQRAFLSTGETRFQDGVVESAETLELDADKLNTMAASSGLLRAPLIGLSASIQQILASVGESDKIRDARGTNAAVSFFDSKEPAMSLAQGRADHLRIEISRRVAERIRGAHSANALVEALLYGAPAATTLGYCAALPNSARLPGRAGMGHRVWDALLTRRGT